MSDAMKHAVVPFRHRRGAPATMGALAGFRVEHDLPFDASVWRATRWPTAQQARGGVAQDVACDDKPQKRLACVATFLCCLTLGVVVAGFVGVGLMWYEATTTVNEIREATRPYVHQVLNHTMNIMDHADESSAGMSVAMSDVVEITHTTVPAMQLALNQTSEIVRRLERLAQHPVLRLSLGDDA